ncbi:MAG TPA: diguanylate cyclase [Elusimicrobia bacterium]|nr:diguanylate cyclase [Elusimicrobiota bacterium]HBT62870.1 diguanylate cyclase [Elusimicrobiota bacterium]
MGGWEEEFPSAITVCDRRGVVLAMNRAAGKVFKQDGGRKLIGKNILRRHPEPARSLLAGMLKRPRTNTYTIEKGKVRKLIHQSPWYRRGRFSGFVELSIILPEKLAHHVRPGPSK